MKLTTGFDFQGYFITEYIDVFFDEMLVGIGLGKSFMASFDNMLSSLSGGEATEMIDKLNTVKATLRKRVINKAESVGANALIGIDFESSRLGDLLMVSMTATAVKIEKIIEPLPLTEGTAARLQREKELAEKARVEAEEKQRLEAERKEKILRGEAVETDRAALLETVKQMNSAAEMYDLISSTVSEDPTLLSEEQLERLRRSKETARIYGNVVGTKDFIRMLERYLLS